VLKKKLETTSTRVATNKPNFFMLVNPLHEGR